MQIRNYNYTDSLCQAEFTGALRQAQGDPYT